MAEIGRAKIILEIEGASYSAALDKANSKLKIFGQQAAAAGHASVSSTQAASAAIRVLEGGMTGNIRAAEKFIATIPGVGKALQAAFPLVGAIALGGVFAKMGTELVKFIETTNKVPKAIEQAFQSLHTSASIANDDLQISTDKLRNQLALLEHKPVNMAALALHETYLEADKLTKSLEDSDKALQALMKDNQISAIGAFLTGKAGTADVSGSLQSYHDQESDLGYQHAQAVRSGNSSLAASLMKQLNDKITSEHQYTQREIAGFRAGHGFGDPTANIKLLQGDDQNITDTQDTAKNTKDNKDAQLALDTETKRQEAARKALEAARAAAKAQLDQWNETLHAMKAGQEMTLNQEASFWIGRAAMVKNGSLQYKAAMDEANKAMAAQQAEVMRGHTEFNKLSQSILPTSMDRDNAPEKDQGREVSEWLKNLNQGIALNHENADAIAEASLQMAVATGQMSKLDAAQAQAALHAQEYAEYMAALQVALANAANLPAGFARDSAIAGLNNQGTAMSGVRAVQSQQDSASIYGQTATGQTVNALNQMVQQWDSMAASVIQVFTRAADQLNSDLANAMLGGSKKHLGDQIGSTLHGAASGLMKAGLQKGESALMKALGFGGGDKVQKVHVENWPGGAAAGGLGGGNTPGLTGIAGKAVGWLGKLFGGGGGGATSVIPEGGGYDFGSNPLQSLLGSMPMLAGGGEMPAGSSAWVGEKGPEIFHSKSAGSIIPNHKLSGGGTTHTYMIDARGSNDPAAIHAAVARALPHAVAASMQAQHQHAKRTPAGR